MNVTDIKKLYDEKAPGWKFPDVVEADVRKDFLDGLIQVENYIPLSVKHNVIMQMLFDYTDEDGTFHQGIVEEVDGYKKMPVLEFKVIRDMTMISLYTDIEFDEENGIEAYDMLNEMGVADWLYEVSDDCKQFYCLVDDIVANEIYEYNGIQAVLNRGLKRIEDSIVSGVEKLLEKMETMNITPEMLDGVSGTIESINNAVKDVKAITNK